MKHNKRLKKLDYSRPQLWYQPTKWTGLDGAGRLRLISPNETAEWSCDGWNVDFKIWDKCCWDITFNIPLYKGFLMSERIKEMHNYDKKEGWPRAEFVGYV